MSSFQLQQPPRLVHGISPGCKWRRPPIDGSLTTPQIHDWHYKNNPDYDVFVFAKDNHLEHLTFSQVVPAAHRAARFFANAMSLDLNSSTKTFPTIALIAKLDHITYFTSILGLMRAGIPVFSISPRHPTDTIENFLNLTKPTHVFTGEDNDVREILKEAIASVASKNDSPKIILATAPKYEEIYLDGVEHEPLPERVYDYSAPVVITNSSGSTGRFPKAVVWNGKCILQTGMSMCYGERDLCGKVVSLHMMKVYDHIAINFISWLAFSGLILTNFAPESPVPDRTPDEIYDVISVLRPDYVLFLPRIVELYSLDPKKVAFLAGLKGVVYGGSPIDPTIGEELVRRGVTLLTTYGMAEAGVVGTLWPEHPGMDYEYFKINGQCGHVLQPRGDGTVVLVIVSGPTQEMTVSGNTVVDGKKALVTGDVLAPHPTKTNYWKVLGRVDDIITLSSGETVHPRYLERVLQIADPRIEGALMFGANRARLGMIVDLQEPYKFDVANKEQLEQFRTSLEPALALMNTKGPSYAHVSKDMIIPSVPSKPLLYTNKGPLNRVLNTPVYVDEIEAVYKDVGLV